MPQVDGVTVNGVQLLTTVNQTVLGSMAIWFPRPFVPALNYRRVGVLRLSQITTARELIQYDWEVVYPGIWPLQPGANRIMSPGFFILECSRPGLPYSLFWT